ncbi:hypothetical protein ANCDUO_10532 [Ancylostoma duodenale]|uniref:Uncharacterized protein n=1 Tax=Ancylostoma duodenale TaxID=51022 RepID=A0A0C2GDL0_9BILA|nr:hypothetical protein ANCDUO_10532 [Ancylostoma duodenale]
MREEVCMLRSRYEGFVKSFLKLLEKHCPELIPQLQALSRKQVQLKRLKWVNRGRDLLSSCRTLMKDSRCDWTKLTENFRNACLHAQEQVELTDNSRVTFIDGLNSLAPDLNEFARKRSKEILDTIKYPFEDSIDTRAFTDEATMIANILSLIYSVAEHTKEGTGYLSQTLNWIQVNMPFFETVQGIVIKEHNLSKSPASVFLKYLSELSISKTKTLLKQEKVGSQSSVAVRFWYSI